MVKGSVKKVKEFQGGKLSYSKDLSKIKPGFKSVPLQICFDIAWLASAKKWHKIQNMNEEERF